MRSRASLAIHRRLALAALFAAMLTLPGCLDVHSWVEKPGPWTQATVAHADQVRIERADGTEVTVEHPRIGEDERGRFLAGRVHGVPGQDILRLDLADIRNLEVREVDAGKIAAGVAVLVLVVAAAYLYLFQPYLPSG